MKELENIMYSVVYERFECLSGKDADKVMNWYAENRSENGGLRDPSAKPIAFRVRRQVGPLPWLIDRSYLNSSFLVSEQLAEALKPFLKVPPVKIPVSGYPRLTTDQWCAIIEVTSSVDAANLSASEAHPVGRDPDPHLENLDSKKRVVLDPTRIPVDEHLFYVHRTGDLVLSSAVKRAIRRAKVANMKLCKHDFLEEPEEIRQSYLEKLKHEAVLVKEEYKRLDAERALIKRPEPDAACIAGWASIKKALGRNVGKEFENHNIFDEDDFLEHNTLLRQDAELAWPADYWAIAEDGRGGYWTLRLEPNGTTTGEVWYYDHELATPGPKGGKATPNFESCAPSLRAWVTLLKKGEDGL